MGIGYFTGTSHDTFSSYGTSGKTFQASANNFVLNSITFYLDNESDSPINLLAEVSAWNGQNLAGSALFASSSVTVANNANGFQVVTVPNSDFKNNRGATANDLCTQRTGEAEKRRRSHLLCNSPSLSHPPGRCWALVWLASG